MDFFYRRFRALPYKVRLRSRNHRFSPKSAYSLWFWVSSDPSLYLDMPRKVFTFLGVSIELSSRAVARKVFSPLQSLTSVFGMGTGGPSAFVTLTFYLNSKNISLFSENWTTNSIFLFISSIVYVTSRLTYNTFSIERRWSSRTFRYGYLVTT